MLCIHESMAYHLSEFLANQSGLNADTVLLGLFDTLTHAPP